MADGASSIQVDAEEPSRRDRRLPVTHGRGGLIGWLRRQRRSWPFYVALIIVLFLIVAPLSMLVQTSLRGGRPGFPEEWSPRFYAEAFGNPLMFHAFRNTIIVATISTCISMFFGVFFAWLLERTDVPFRNTAWSLMLLPIAVPNILFVVSWVLLLAPRAGLINVELRNILSFFGFNVGTEGPINIYSLGGVIFLDSMRGVVTIFLMMVAAFRMFDPSLEESARVSGASTLQTLRRITLPALAPALLAAAMYSFISSMDQFEAALAAGLPAGVFLLPTLIYYSVSFRIPAEYGLAAVYSVMFMVIMFLLVIMYRRAVRHSRQFATVTGKGYRPRRIALGKWRWPAFGVVAGFALGTVILPALTLAWIAFRPTREPIRLRVPVEYSFVNFQRITHGSNSTLINTLQMTVMTATVTMIIAFLVSWVIVRSSKFRGGLLDGLSFLPYAFPGITIGLAFLFVFLNRPFNVIPVYGTLWILVIALTTQYIAFGTRLMTGAIMQVQQDLEDAGSISGASYFSVARRITLPLIFPGLIAGWIWVAANASRSFAVPLVLASRRNAVIASEIWEGWQRGVYGEVAAYGVTLMAILLPMAILLRHFMAKSSGMNVGA